jgi:hypothetical protein
MPLCGVKQSFFPDEGLLSNQAWVQTGLETRPT